MALWLEPNAENVAPEAQADLDALSALRESAAIELKEKGNEYVKMGKKHYKDAIYCYTRAIHQKSMDAVNTSTLHANRAQVHLLLGNNRRAFDDAKQAIQLNTANIKAYFRGAKAALALGNFSEAIQFCSLGLDQEPNSIELLKLKAVTEDKLKESAAVEEQRALKVAKSEMLASVIVDRNVSVGELDFQELINGRKPWLDESKLLHWPVLLLYPESMTSDIIEDFCEFDSFSSHLDVIFGPDITPMPWDNKQDYTRDKVQLFYKANIGPKLSEKQLLCYLLEGKNISDEETSFEDAKDNNGQTDNNPLKSVPVSENSSLHNVLESKDHIIPGIPVFYVLSKGSKYCKEFLSGRW